MPSEINQAEERQITAWYPSLRWNLKKKKVKLVGTEKKSGYQGQGDRERLIKGTNSVRR